MAATDLLKAWNLSKYIEKFTEDGWDDANDWGDLIADDCKELKDMGLAKGHIRKFERNYKEWCKKNKSKNEGSSESPNNNIDNNIDNNKDATTKGEKEPGNNEEQVSPSQSVTIEDELHEFCINNNLDKYYDKLKNEMEFDLKTLLNYENIDEIIDELGIKFGAKAKFIKAVNDTKLLSNNDVIEWCNENGWDFGSKIIKLGKISSTNELIKLNNNKINELCKNIGLKFGKKSKFLQKLKEKQNNNKNNDDSKNGDKKETENKETENKETENKEDDIKIVKPKKIKPFKGKIGNLWVKPKKKRGFLSMKPHRTIMVIGETGTGKTTTLDAMMNYLYNIDYDDKCRLKIINEPKKESQADSQTDDLSSYYIEPPAISYGLTLIDSPGFGDTRGISRDKQITKDIKKFFETEISEIDGICFVIRAPQARVTAQSKYVFDAVLSVFGKDIVDNIFILFTFADAKIPPAVDALKTANIPFNEYFKFNNSAFDLPPNNLSDQEKMFNKMFWDMGIFSFKAFFDKLKCVKSKSLQLTQQVLKNRQTLEARIESINPVINNGLNILENMRQTMQIIKQNEGIINDMSDKKAKNFQIITTVTKQRKVKLDGTHTTTCRICNHTCHDDCIYSNDNDKRGCSAMGSDGYCQCCPRKCFWDQHSNYPYRLETYTEDEVQSLDNLKQQYMNANSKKSASTQILDGLKKRLQTQSNALSSLINEVRCCINELEKIALKPNPMNTDDYFDVLIESEKSKKEKGWQGRINALNNLKKQKQMIRNVNDKNFNPWEQYIDVTQELPLNIVNVSKIEPKNKPPKKQKQGFFGSLFG